MKASSNAPDYNSELKLKGFKVYETNIKDKVGHIYSRKDFYKINISTGKYIFHYADKSFETDKTFLFFANPHVPYSCEVIAPTQNGYTCLFAEEFLKASDRSESLQQSPLFRIGGTPILQLNNEQKKYITSIFQRMLVEQGANYAFKDELIRNHINLIIHEALKMEPSENLTRSRNAAERITAVFLELLERQFPIESVERPLTLKTAQDFASSLSIHVNYLNGSVKEVTGKSTTTHIGDRIVHEATALLQHTNWNVADIAYALGFEYPTYFNNFFKKKTGQIPKAIRSVAHL
jgi:AraC family transcriptional regulator, transcriptional activator of pobA